MTKPTITQADREAAASVVGFHGRQIGFDAEIKAAREDDCPLVQAFAAHREAAVAELRVENERIREALAPFAACMEYISDDEDGEEWAKFRLLIKDYRAAHAALSQKETSHGS